jgi:hypothetical protein
MRLTAFFSLLVGLASAGTMTLAQSAKSFPSADTMLKDAKHKEPKSGVQVGPDNSITIQSGVGMLVDVTGIEPVTPCLQSRTIISNSSFRFL